MPTKYLELRANAPFDALFAFCSLKAWDASTSGPIDLSIDIYSGHEKDAGDLRADPQNVVVLDAEIALELVKPKTQAPAGIAT